MNFKMILIIFGGFLASAATVEQNGKLLHEVNFTAYKVSKGSEFKLTIEKAVTDLTPEMIASGSWKNANFKPYNFAALGISPQAGHLHPLLKVRAEYRQIFLEMGFSEMPTNNYVESR